MAKRDIQIMRLNESGDLGRDTTLIQVNGETLITVRGFGTGLFRWTVANSSWDKSGYEPEKLFSFDPELIGPDGLWPGIETLGAGFVLLEPTTFAHAIMDNIENS